MFMGMDTHAGLQIQVWANEKFPENNPHLWWWVGGLQGSWQIMLSSMFYTVHYCSTRFKYHISNFFSNTVSSVITMDPDSNLPIKRKWWDPCTPVPILAGLPLPSGARKGSLKFPPTVTRDTHQ